MRSIASTTTLLFSLTLAACEVPATAAADDGHDSSSDDRGSSDDGHDSTTGLGGTGQAEETTTDDGSDTTECPPIECPEPPPADSCILPEGGTVCQSVAFVGTVICEDSGLGDLCWPVVAAQYIGYEGLEYAAIAAMLCEPGAVAFCAAPPVGALPWATCSMVDVASCEANAAAAGLVGAEVTAICEALVAEAF